MEIKQKPCHFVKMSEHHLWDLSLTTCPFDVKLSTVRSAFCVRPPRNCTKGYCFYWSRHLITFTFSILLMGISCKYFPLCSIWPNFLAYSTACHTYSLHSWINIIVTQNYLCDFIYHSMFEPPERRSSSQMDRRERRRRKEKNGQQQWTIHTHLKKKCTIN